MPLRLQNSPATRCARHGSVLAEFLIVLPVLLLGVLAVVEFGLWMSATEKIEMAARVGVEAASETPRLGGLASLRGTSIQRSIYRNLEAKGIPTNRVQIVLIHNVGPGGQLVDSRGRNSPLPQLPPLPGPTSTRFVRVVVSIPAADAVPNLLALLAFDANDYRITRSKTYHYELEGSPQ